MADAVVCPICERVVKSYQSAIECCGCLLWIHKTCTAVSKIEFDSICSKFKKTGSHNWKCKNCCQGEVRRLSAGPSSVYCTVGRDSSHVENRDYQVNESVNTATEGNLPPNFDVTAPLINMKSKVEELSKRNNISNKDLITVFAQFFTLFLDQFKVLHNDLIDIKTVHKNRIDRLETEIDVLKVRIQDLSSSLRDTSSDSTNKSQSAFQHTFTEIQERNEKSKNIIVYNIEECKSMVVSERVDYDKLHITKLLENLEMDTTHNFKVARIGKPSQKARPIRVMFHDQLLAKECLKRKKKLNGSNLNIKSDLTLAQRTQIREAYAELALRKEKGETDLIISFRKGIPLIIKDGSHKKRSDVSLCNDVNSNSANLTDPKNLPNA